MGEDEMSPERSEGAQSDSKGSTGPERSEGPVGYALEGSGDVEGFIERLKGDLDLWAGFCIPHIASLHFPPFYHTVWKLLISKIIDLGTAMEIIFRFALGLPRGHAKTTFVKLILAYSAVFRLRDFFLIVCSNERLSERLSSDVVDILRSDNLISLFGSWDAGLEKDTQSLKITNYMGRKMVIAAVGAGTSIRGINVGHMRPDFIVMDDMQSRECAESPAERASLERWATATLFKVAAPRGAFLFYIGNMYNEDCLLYKFQQSEQWTTLITGAILADGSTLWPEHKPLRVLEEEWKHDMSLGLGDIFYAEVQNDPKSVSLSLLQGGDLKLAPPEGYYDACFITVDPSGIKLHSDNNAIVAHGVIGQTGYVLDADDGCRLPIQVIEKIIEFSVKYNVSVVGIESVAYQSTLMFWVNYILEERGIKHFPHIIELPAWGRNKELRINSWVQACLTGMYRIVGEHAYGLVLREALAYRFGQAKNDDNVLDACAYGIYVINNHKPQLYHGPTIQDNAPQARVRSGTSMDTHSFRSM